MRTVIAVVLLSVLSGVSSAAVLTVDCGGGADYDSIQAAVGAAGLGDTVLIAPCVYYEHVDASGKGLTLIGSGAEVTRLEWGDTEPALRIAETGVQTTRVIDMSLVHTSSGRAARWSSRLSLEGCTVAGLLHGDGYLHPSVSTSLWAANCELDEIELSGGGTSQLTDCDFLVADISGYFEYEYTGVQDVRVTSCTGDTVHVGTVATLHSDGSTFDAVRLHGGLHALPEIWAQDSSLGDLLLTEHCGSVSLVCCDLASLRFDAAEYGSDWFRVTGCAVRGPMQLDVPGLGGRIIHNTILGDFEYADASWGWPHQFQSNIVTGAASIAAEDPLVASHNDFVGDVFIVADGDSVVANMSEPPLFCGEPDDLTLQDCSLCVGSAHDGGDIGAFSVGCECAVAIERSSWGGIKGLYR